MMGSSIDHPDGANDPNNYQRATAKLFSLIVEANPDGGAKMTEVRHIDMAGNLPQMVIGKASAQMPVKNLSAWNKGLKQ